MDKSPQNPFNDFLHGVDGTVPEGLIQFDADHLGEVNPVLTKVQKKDFNFPAITEPGMVTQGFYKGYKLPGAEGPLLPFHVADIPCIGIFMAPLGPITREKKIHMTAGAVMIVIEVFQDFLEDRGAIGLYQQNPEGFLPPFIVLHQVILHPLIGD